MLALVLGHLARVTAFLDAHRLGHVAAALRTYALDWHIYAFALAPALLLERIFPLQRRRTFDGSLLVDFAMPLLDAIVWGSLVNGFGFLFIAALERDAKPFWELHLLDGAPVWIQAPSAYLTASLCAYAAHRCLHRVPFLWRFHAVHHSQEVLNPFTTKRAHIVEDLFTLAIAAIPIGVIGGSYPNWFWIPVLNGYWSFIIHANARTNLGPLRHVLVSPQAHRIHHSVDPKHFDKNFSTDLALWDRLFGTAYPVHDEYPVETGVRGFPDLGKSRAPRAILKSWLALNIYPFRESSASLRASWRRLRRRQKEEPGSFKNSISSAVEVRPRT